MANTCLPVARNLQYTPRTHLATSFPGSLILPQNGVREEIPWLGLVTCHFDNWHHQGRVLGNQAICWVEPCWIQIIAPRPPLPVILILRAEISNSFYSNVYLKVKGTLSRCSARANLTGFFHRKTIELSLCHIMPTRQSDSWALFYIPFATRVHLPITGRKVNSLN